MNYAFKMMAVVLALGVLVLQGCVTSSSSNYSYYGNSLANQISKASDMSVCNFVEENGDYAPFWKTEAKRRGLDCGVGSNNKTLIASKPKTKTKTYIQPKSTISSVELFKFDKNLYSNADDKLVCDNWRVETWASEANRRGLDCDGFNYTLVRTLGFNESPYSKELCSTKFSSCWRLLQKACDGNKFSNEYINRFKVRRAKKNGLDCGVRSNNKIVIASKPKPKTYTKPKSTISSAELDASKLDAETERQKRKELERKLAVLESKQKQEQQRVDTDTRVPLLEIISIKTKGKRGTITGIALDNIEVAEVTIDGKPVSITSNGNFKYSTYVPPTGKELKVQVTDIAGLTTSKIVVLKADRAIADSSISFDSLNPLGKRVKTNKNALALIVGVSNYENTKAKALYADNDAMVFKDYATEKLGVPENRIKILLNDGADERDILLSVQEWLRRSAKPNKSDIYVFFAGHGLASQDGKNMYLLPHDGSPRLLEKTAILRNELFSDIKEANPKSVTVFLDTCYSGETRNEEMLIAGRPIMIKAKKQSIPSGFTLFSAASNEQISRPLEEAKHGMFSYFLMKGMEGDADANSDNKITAQELHNYVKENVTQQSSGSQTPELQGNKDRVLVQFN